MVWAKLAMRRPKVARVWEVGSPLVWTVSWKGVAWEGNLQKSLFMGSLSSDLYMLVLGMLTATAH